MVCGPQCCRLQAGGMNTILGSYNLKPQRSRPPLLHQTQEDVLVPPSKRPESFSLLPTNQMTNQPEVSCRSKTHPPTDRPTNHNVIHRLHRGPVDGTPGPGTPRTRLQTKVFFFSFFLFGFPPRKILAMWG